MTDNAQPIFISGISETATTTFEVFRSHHGTITILDMDISPLDSPVKLIQFTKSSNFAQQCFNAMKEHIIDHTPNEIFSVNVQFFMRRLDADSPNNLINVQFNLVAVSATEYLMDKVQMAIIESLAHRISISGGEGNDEYDRIVAEDDVTHAVTKVRFAVFKLPKRGGCWGNFIKSSMPLRIVKKYLTDPISTDNNCFFACIYLVFKKRLLEYFPDICRYNSQRDLHRVLRVCFGVRHKMALTVREMKECCDRVSVSVVIYSVENTATDTVWYSRYVHKHIPHGNLNDPTLHLMVYNGHCSAVKDDRIMKMVSCRKCSQWLASKNVKHLKTCSVCNTCGRKARGDNHQCFIARDPTFKNVIKDKTINNTSLTCLNNVWFADLETFPDQEGVMHVYSAAIVAVEDISLEADPVGKSRVFYGPDSLSDFCNYVINLNGVVVFYNGSRFDLFFVFKWFVEHHITLKNYMKVSKSNKILSLEVDQVKFWDLCLFTLGSLDATCKAFKTPPQYVKKSFDHSLIRCWEDVYNYETVVTEYNKYDVVSLGFAYKNFAKTIFDLYKFNVTEAFTLSHMAYGIWRNHYVIPKVLDQIQIPDAFLYRYIRNALYGGRCSPQIPYFKTVHYENIVATRKWDWSLKFYDSILDYLVYLDVVSLYPYSSVIGEFPMGKMKLIDGGGLLHPLLQRFPVTALSERDCYYIKRTIACVDVKCPTNLLTGFLMSRGPKGELTQDLTPKKEQYYDGVTLLEAMRLGYRVTRVHSYVLFELLGNPLREYMNYAFTQKNAAEKGSCEYSCHKYLMNGLTGKFSQEMIESNWRILYDDGELTKLSDVSQLKSIEWITNEEGEDVAMAAEIREEDPLPSKPLQLGVSILAHSRVVMSVYTDFIGGYLSPEKASYYGDTDSMIIHYNTYKEAKEKDAATQFLSDEFGKLSNEYKDGKIIKGVFLSPKTYCLEVIKKDGSLVWVIRAKGVPQDIKDVDVDEFYKKEYNEPPDSKSDLKTLSYSLFDPTEKLLATQRYLNMPFFEAMLLRDCFVVVTYGSMKRRLHGKDCGGQASRIRIDLGLERSINKAIWWDSGKRSKPATMLQKRVVTYPKGHAYYPSEREKNIF